MKYLKQFNIKHVNKNIAKQALYGQNKSQFVFKESLDTWHDQSEPLFEPL